FENAWQTGHPPRIEDFLPAGPGVNGTASHRKLLEHLVRIDLEFRWRRAGAGGGGPRLEEYAVRFPELELAEKLVSEEYWVRHLWGDRPDHGEYLARFGHLLQLRAALGRIDGELRAEFASHGDRARNDPPPPATLVPGTGSVMNVSLTTASLLDLLKRYRLLDPAEAGAVDLAELQRRYAEPRALAKELLARRWLTPYQANQLFLGRAGALGLDTYVILERLGEGGMGQVFKARHVDMHRVVALKLVRKELLADSETLSRFRREVQLISQLTDPHIVQAYDAALT